MSFQVGIGSLGETVFFQVGLCTPLQTMNLQTYGYSIYMYILSTFYFQKKMKVAEGTSNYLPTKHAMKLRKFPHLLSVEGVGGTMGRMGGGIFTKKNKLKSKMLKCLTTKKVDNVFLFHY